MAHDISVKQKAIELRQAGHSIKEIAKLLNIAISSSSVWLRSVKVSPTGQDRMIKRKEQNRYKMQQKWIEKRHNRYVNDLEKANVTLSSLDLANKNIAKMICSILFWAEGNKDFSHIRFTNSDPLMIKTFMFYLRKAYNLDESKFRACIHLHEYHNNEQLHSYWSSITNIPLLQFRKPYLKPHTGKRKKLNYMGCTTIYYFDSSIAHELEALYNAISSNS